MRIVHTLVFALVFAAACGPKSTPAPTPTPDPAPDTAAPCFKGGCSGQLCSDREGLNSTCEFRPEYACYNNAECARQPDGTCGWTPTEELTACLASPPAAE